MAKKSPKSSAPVCLPTKKEEPARQISQSKPKKPVVTQIVVRCDCGFPNALFIRGEGLAALSWDKGLPMKNVSADQWVWESDRPCSTVQFKVLINDTRYEIGENHSVAFGQRTEVTPKFA